MAMSDGGTRTSLPPRTVWSLQVLALLAMTFFAAELPLPARAVALAPALVALWLSVHELLRQRRDDAPAGERVAPSITIVVVAFVLVLGALQAALYGPLKEYQDCVDRANTQAAQAQCDTLQAKLFVSGATRVEGRLLP